MVISLCVAGVLCAQEVDPVESGGDALQRAGSLPWYDAESDSVVPVNVRPPGDPPPVSDAETYQSSQPNRNQNNTTNWNGAGGGFWYVLQWIGWGLIALIIIGLLVLIIRAIADKTSGSDLDLPESSRRIVSDVDRMEQLPIPLKRNLSDLLGEARRQYGAGNYNEAIVYLYSYLLVELDKAQRIRLLRGKTNRQYLRELRDAPPTLGDLVEQTMIAFEDVFFGDHNLERAGFEACYNQLDQFHQLVEAEPVAA